MSGSIDIKDFYRTVESGKDLEITSLNQTQITNKAADRDRAVQKKLEMEATAQRLALENEQLQKQVQLLKPKISNCALNLKRKNRKIYLWILLLGTWDYHQTNQMVLGKDTTKLLLSMVPASNLTIKIKILVPLT